MDEQQWAALGLTPLSRVGLDELLQELLDRVGDVMDSRERLRGLLDAVVGIGTDLDLRATLERVVVSACRLVDARYGALGVIGAGRTLSEFITCGVDSGQRGAIGHPPVGRGVLGLLLDDPRPIRLPDVTAHPAAAGYPPHHPPMHSFLGVPIIIREHVFGNLYLTEKNGAAEFSADDEEVVVALAAAAGAAIENARLYALAQHRQRWLAATTEVITAVAGSSDRDAALSVVAARARRAAGAELVAVLLHDEAAGTVSVAAVDAAEPMDDLIGSAMPLAETAFATILDHQQQEILEDLSKAAPWPVPMRSLRASAAPFGGTRGLLLVTSSTITSEDEELPLLGLFAGQAAVALEREQSHLDREQLLVLSDRERIARDLHDVVVQRLFATGLQLQTVVTMSSKQELANRVNQSIDALDTTIRDIRSAIFELRASTGTTLSGRLRDIVDELPDGLGFRPTLRLEGPLDSAVPEHIHGDVLAVVGEALSNVVQHAHATRAEVVVATTGQHLAVTVIDDGCGGAVPIGGLINIKQRAERHHGRVVLDSAPAAGTRLTWKVPLG